MAAFRVVLDACVLLPQTLNNLMLTLAEAELFHPVWTSDLLDEVQRNLSGDRFGKTPEQAAHRVAQMRAAFPFAEEECRGHRELIPAMTNDPKDRHVLAAAVRSGASLIVTANLTDFPPAALEPFGVEAISPDEFLCDQLDLDAGTVLQAMRTLVARNRLPPHTVRELLTSLEKLTPHFVTVVRSLLLAHSDASASAVAPANVALPELTDDQLEALEPDLREAYLQLRAMDPAERARFTGHTGLMRQAWAFLTPVCEDADLESVWGKVDPDFREVLAREWVQDNHRDLVAGGWDGAAVEAALTQPEPHHPLWPHFQRVQVRSIRAMLPNPTTWGIGTGTRMVAPGLELLYVHDTSTLDGGVVQPGEARPACPILLHLVDGQWLVRNIGSDQDPMVGA